MTKKNNCIVTFSDGSTQEFYDPFIRNINGECWFWTGDTWAYGVSSAGQPIMENLEKFVPKSKNDCPPELKT